MLEIRYLTLTVGQRTLFADLSFTACPGETVAITGASGSGKSTLLRAIMGVVPCQSGLISIDGERLTPSSAAVFRRMMSYVPQDVSLPAERVSELARLPFTLKANRQTVCSRKALLGEWEQLGLSADLYTKRTDEVSGGERQRIVLASCGLLGKRIILCDEPTSALDAASAGLVLQYLKSKAAAGAIVVAVTHDMTFAEACDKIVRLENQPLS